MMKKNSDGCFGYAYQVISFHLMRFVILIFIFFIYNFRMLRSAAALFIFDLKLVLKKDKHKIINYIE